MSYGKANLTEGGRCRRPDRRALARLTAAGDVLTTLENARARAAAVVGRLSGRVAVAATPSVVTGDLAAGPSR